MLFSDEEPPSRKVSPVIVTDPESLASKERNLTRRLRWRLVQHLSFLCTLPPLNADGKPLAGVGRVHSNLATLKIDRQLSRRRNLLMHHRSGGTQIQGRMVSQSPQKHPDSEVLGAPRSHPYL